jgi:uncharacterized membrane protein
MTTQDSFPYSPDDPNPYAPPQAKQEWEPAATATSVPVSIGDVLERTWEIYRDRMGLCIGVFITYGILFGGGLVILGIVEQAVGDPMDPVPPLVAVGWMLVFFLFVLWITLGLMRVMLDIARGREVSTGGLFQGARFLLPTIIAHLLFALAVMLMAGVAAFLAAFMTGMMIGAVRARPAVGVLVVLMGVTVAAAYIAVFIFSLRLSQFLYLIIDRDVGALDALQISFRITRGHVGMLFVLTILAGLINFCGMMACGVGMLFTTPYILLLMAVAYLALSGQTAVDPYAKGEPPLDL